MNKAAPKIGRVWLAGAGPGDAGLLTVKVKKLIEYADVIVYDALVSAEIISQIPSHCQLIFVGKRSGHHHLSQAEINEILLKEALQGKKVLRLKGGDPFVFGRGGEELELLIEHEIPFEVIPGVTSATAVPAYAGIPVTHRDHTSSFHIITGHPRKDGTNRINYAALAALKATLVFLMGIGAMEEICQGLLAAGMDKDTPAAILEKGTTAFQRRVISTVGQLCTEARRSLIGTPAIILVGAVCSLGNIFHWAEDRALGGCQFLITRPRASGSKLADRLRELGAQVIELPSIETKTLTPNPAFEQAMLKFARMSDEAWLVFTSPTGVQSFFALLGQSKQDMRSLLKRNAEVKFAVVGLATAKELNKYGFTADVMPAKFCGAALGQQLIGSAKAGSQVLVMRAKEGAEELLPALAGAGFAVEDVPVYETVYETHEPIREKISQIYHNGEINAVIFTSAATVHGFVKTMKETDYGMADAVCIGEQTAAAAKSYGMRTMISSAASIDSLVETVAALYG